MRNATIGAFVVALFVSPASSAAPQEAAQTGKTMTLSSQMQRGYQSVQQALTDAAEKMPDEQYGFKPTPEIKPFGQLVAHVALAQFGACAILTGQPNPRKDEKEDASRTKAEALALLKASSAYCDQPVSALTDTAMSELTKFEQNQVAKGLIPVELVAHGMEMYGTMAVYLRLKGIVPHTTEREKQMKKSQ